MPSLPFWGVGFCSRFLLVEKVEFSWVGDSWELETLSPTENEFRVGSVLELGSSVAGIFWKRLHEVGIGMDLGGLGFHNSMRIEKIGSDHWIVVVVVVVVQVGSVRESNR